MSKLSDWWLRFEGNALFSHTRLVARTARFTVEGQANATLAQANGRSLLWSMWHGQVWPFIIWRDRLHDGPNFCLVRLGGDERSNILYQLGDKLGAQTHAVDMEGNPVAGGRAVLRVIQAMKGGKQSFIAPDGPNGPAYIPKPGVAFLARKAEAAILPFGAWTRHTYLMKRWDSYFVPFPFAHFHIHIGTPIFVDRKSDDAETLQQVTEALHAARTRAQIMAGVEPWR
ncbi:MAG: hypothetical protein KDE56_13815 [Anaerolineales bacterium]|nr:hypothetical protein [Anaerolineales bacterium]